MFSVHGALDTVSKWLSEAATSMFRPRKVTTGQRILTGTCRVLTGEINALRTCFRTKRDGSWLSRFWSVRPEVSPLFWMMNTQEDRYALTRLAEKGLAPSWEFLPLGSDAENDSTLYHVEFSELLSFRVARYSGTSPAAAAASIYFALFITSQQLDQEAEETELAPCFFAYPT